MLDPAGVTPHGSCLPWAPWLTGTQAAAGSVTGLAYVSIAVALAYISRRRPGLLGRQIFWLLAGLVVLCGTGWWLDVATLWVPVRGLKMAVDAATALVALAAAAAVWRLMPQIVALPSPRQLQQANTALRASELRARVMFSQAPLPLVSLDADGRLVAANERALGLLGVATEGDVLGCRLGDFLAGDAAGTFGAAWQECLARGRCDDVALRISRRSGGTAEILWSAHREQGRPEDPVRILGSLVDVTARRSAERMVERDRAVRLALESTGESVFTVAPDWRLTFLSGRAVTLFGQGRELVGELLWDVLPGEPGEGLRAACERCMAERVAVETEQFYEPHRRFYAARAFSSEDGGITVFLRDRTPERELATRLSEREEVLRAIGEATSDLLFAKDRGGRVLYANRANLAVIGRSLDQVLGRSAREFRPRAEAEGVMLSEERIMSAGQAETLDERLYDAVRGEVRTWQTTKTPLRDKVSGEVVGIAGVSRDVTDRLRAEQALKDSEARLRDLVETVDLGAFMTRDADGVIRFWSGGCARLYGWTAEEAEGRVAHDLLHTEFPMPLDVIVGTVEREGAWRGDLKHTTRDGRELVIAALFVLRRVPRGRPVILEVLTDVTAQRQAEAALGELNQHLEERVRDEVAAREEIQEHAKRGQHMQALGEIAGGVAHQFNNILQAVLGALHLIETRATDASSVRRFTRIAMDASERGATITSRLLSFARRSQLSCQCVDPAQMLDSLRELLAHTLGGRVTLRLDLPPGLPSVNVDKSQMETALLNLVSNAGDAMPDDGTITLTAVAENVPPAAPHPARLAAGLYLRVVVRDVGVGMDPATLARAADPFFTTKPPGGGTGLGLSMVKGFAEQSGGGLTIESAPGAGTTVTFWLPAVQGTAPTPRRSLRTFGAPSLPARRILLVDDEVMVRETIAAGLEDSGYAVLVAQSGREAIALLDAGEQVDVLVTDLAMPGMDGLELVRKAVARRRHLATIILTGFLDLPGSDAEREADGPSAVLHKPLGARELAGRIEDVLAAEPEL